MGADRCIQLVLFLYSGFYGLVSGSWSRPSPRTGFGSLGSFEN